MTKMLSVIFVEHLGRDEVKHSSYILESSTVYASLNHYTDTIIYALYAMSDIDVQVKYPLLQIERGCHCKYSKCSVRLQ